MKKVVSLLLAGLMVFALVGCGSKKEEASSDAGKNVEIVCAISPDYPPYESLDTNGEIIGFDADMVALFPSYLNDGSTQYTFKFVQMNFDNIITQLQGGQADLGISGFTYDEERKVEWSQPYLGTDQVAVVAADSDIKTLADLEGKTIAAQSGATGEKAAKDVKNAKVVAVTKVDEIFSALTSKQYDAVVVDSAVAKNYAANQGFRVLEEPLLAEKNYIIAKQGNTEMIELVNKALEKFLASEDYKKLCEKWEVAPLTE